jgi:NNP family nitrate/nitrite transporter-like MFS transporter
VSSKLQLAVGTTSFAICFATWGLIAAFAPTFRQLYHLNATQAAFLIAVPVLLGSLARIPMGILTDRFGGRRVFTLLVIFCAAPAFAVPLAGSFTQLIAVAFFLGLAGSSFAVGVGYVSKWFPPARQGGALGIYGAGNIGQSAAVFLGPVLAASIGWQNVFRAIAALLVVWGIAFAVLARNAPARTAAPPRQGALKMFVEIGRQRLAWVLALFYFLTFGGFVAFSIYLPTLLKEQFGLTPNDAGFRAAGFVVLATVCRPIGGWLADQIGGSRVLAIVFLGIAPFAMLLAWPSMLPFTVGALGCAALLGLGNGAVFKLVPEHFPAQTGTVTGLVGAMGGLGGFFPPLLLGVFRDRLGLIWPAFLLLAITSLAMWWINFKIFGAREEAREMTGAIVSTRTSERTRAGAWATFWTGALLAAIVVGSRNLENFDPALVIYTFAVVFACWGVVYHYNVWLGKPPTRMYWRRGWQIFRKRGVLRSLIDIFRLGARNIVAQTFIRRRSRLRWWMHQCLFWGCLLAVAITFPLVFGWISFQSRLDNQMTYVLYLFGFRAGEFPVPSFASFMMFHGLDIAAVLVLAGIFLSLWRRMRDRGAQTVQSFAMDFYPLIILFAISITGLALTVSQAWLRGELYGFLAILHAITVIAGLLYLPFGKFFHIFQRPAQLGVKLYQLEGEKDAGAICPRCGERFASQMHVEDLKRVTAQLGFDYSVEGPAGSWVAVCPPCKRKSLSIAQLRMKESSVG